MAGLDIISALSKIEIIPIMANLFHVIFGLMHQCLNRAILSRKFSIKALAKYRNSAIKKEYIAILSLFENKIIVKFNPRTYI